MRKKTLLTGLFGLSLLTGVLVGCKKGGNEDQYEDGKLMISFRNLYFDDYTVGDDYLKEVENKFEIKVSTSAYSWSDWNTQVNSAVMGGELDDVFHANIDAYNFASYYKYWADNDIIKPLPDDLSKWPYLKAMIDNTTNIDSLKVNGGHLYGIPIAKNTTDYSTKFSPFTYVYRRDWAEAWKEDYAAKFPGEENKTLPADDVYTWDEFTKLVEVFAEHLNGTQAIPFGDVEWGFPSVTNFYKQVPHCFAQDSSGHYVNNYTTEAYLKGLEASKDFRANRWYAEEEGTAPDGTFNTKFTSNLVGIFYENLSYSNYINIRNALRDTNASDVSFDIDKATRIMKIKCPTDSEYAGKFALEGTDNWFSMTFLNYDISDNKMNKILDLYDWLLSPEGTRFAIYGFEGYEYEMVDGEARIIEENWDKDENGNYSPKRNGAKYLRYMVSLGYDTLEYDPFTDKHVVEYLDNWEAEMKTALDNGQLHILKETPEVMWLTTSKKAEHSGTLRTEALKIVKRYVIGDKEIKTQSDFISQVANGRWKNQWDEVLSEINRELGV